MACAIDAATADARKEKQSNLWATQVELIWKKKKKWK